MTLQETMTQRLKKPQVRGVLEMLYGHDEQVLSARLARLAEVANKFAMDYPESASPTFFSTPGRTEVGGNHTDHNHGRVLAASVDLDVIALAAPRDDARILIQSAGYPPIEMDVTDLEKNPEERFSSTALVRGICARLSQLGYKVGGFQAVISSAVPKGSGLSSSAAYEVSIGTILNHLYNEGGIDPVTIAKIAQFAENNYFGKPCGLMDQTTCSVGGFVTIDFQDPQAPVVRKVNTDFEQSGLALVIVETGGDHADLNDEYASVAGEMRAIARALGGEVMRDVRLADLEANLPRLREEVNDRAILRAFHFLDENERVLAEVAALEEERYSDFLRLVVASGQSSWLLNQNCFSTQKPLQQGIPLALTLSERLLGREGAYRVHGGGFAGTIQAFVPQPRVEDYVTEMRRVFGQDACYAVSIRGSGSQKLAI